MLQAVNDFIIVEDNLEKEKTEGGLLLSDRATKDMRYKRARVVTVGNKVLVVKEEDKVYYDSAGSFTIMVMGRALTVIRENAVILVDKNG
jgi:co-chaperonin GroES (HSP10)